MKNKTFYSMGISETAWRQWNCLKSVKQPEVSETAWSQWNSLKSVKQPEVSETTWSQWNNLKSVKQPEVCKKITLNSHVLQRSKFLNLF
jgi:hypothetical protein